MTTTILVIALAVSIACNFASVRAWLKTREDKFAALARAVAAEAKVKAQELVAKV